MTLWLKKKQTHFFITFLLCKATRITPLSMLCPNQNIQVFFVFRFQSENIFNIFLNHILAK